MDKNLINLFRKLLALDSNTLPDSISPEQFGKLIEDSASKLFIKPEDFKKLQQTLSAKDVDMKKLADDLKIAQESRSGSQTENDKKISELSESVKKLTETITVMHTQQESENLVKLYPDILPDLLIGKTKEQAESVVARQRDINKKLYGDSNRFAPPDYSSEAEIDEKVESVKADKTKSGITSAVEVLNLGRKRAALPKV